MTEIERAIKTLSGWCSIKSVATIEDMDPVTALDMAIDALRREQERSKGCQACKTGKVTLHIPEFRAMAVCNQHLDHEAFDIEIRTGFCLYCGRPLTEAENTKPDPPLKP